MNRHAADPCPVPPADLLTGRAFMAWLVVIERALNFKSSMRGAEVVISRHKPIMGRRIIFCRDLLSEKSTWPDLSPIVELRAITPAYEKGEEQ